MNWGAKIAMLYGGFVVMIASLVGATFFHKSELVADDYYHRETIFQQQLNAQQAAAALGEPVQVSQKQTLVSLRFPSTFKGQAIKGTVHFYAPASATADRSFDIEETGDNSWAVERSKLADAKYEVQVSWSAAGKDYYQAVPLNLQQ